jgi:hypothetical protein
MEYPNDEWKPSAEDAYDPEVDDAITKHKVEAPDAYENTGTLSRPSRSSRPQLTEGVLRDLGKHGARGAGFSGNTPINPQQLKSEAQTRNFFDRIHREKLDPNSSRNLDPYGSINKGRLATPSEIAYLNAHGSKTESQISQDIRNELYAKDPKARADSPLGMYDTQNDTEEDKRINKENETGIHNGIISHHNQRWTEKFKGMPEYESGDFGRLYKEQVDDFVAKNPAYKNQLKKGGYAGFQVKEINPYQVMEQVMLENQVSAKPSAKPSANPSVNPSVNPPIKEEDKETWKTDAGRSADMSDKERNQKLSKPSRYFSVVDGRYVRTNEYDQPQHTEQLASIAFNNIENKNADSYIADLRNSINAEMLNGGGKRGSIFGKVDHDKPPTKNESAAINQMADDLLQIRYHQNILKNNQSKSINRTNQQIIDHIKNLENRYNEKMKEAQNMWYYSAST